MRRTTRGENVKVILPFCRMGPCVALLFIVYLLRSCEAQGPNAVTPVFVKKGDDLILNVDADVPEDVLIVDWNFNKTVKLVRFTSSGQPTVFVDFIGRIEFPVKKFSVKLKNLQKADSGVYTALVLTALGDKLAEYKVTVEETSPLRSSVSS
ncbi:uncharacterized protein LOC129089418 isoform X2 [Anoplopoma fimbria]|uniref:uncharacterized protein LOC129089418 isoform X2 n=1 Tax=Anoplopoma fimbria TaxID=229290 RepID=UPI0023EC6F9B|nr:uncharacterized protein LOC129089418 isoform X2 [Anoplopoma fimbria]